MGQCARRQHLPAWRLEARLPPGLGGSQVVLGRDIYRQQQEDRAASSYPGVVRSCS
jgi:hypothetical protein